MGGARPSCSPGGCGAAGSRDDSDGESCAGMQMRQMYVQCSWLVEHHPYLVHLGGVHC